MTTVSINCFLAELKGIFRLARGLLKAIFEPNTPIFCCPFCNQTLTRFQRKCDRCDSKLGWE